MRNIFTQHPHEVGETYLQHMGFAFQFGFKMIVAGLACITHAIFPFLFPKTGSHLLIKIVEQIVERTPKLEKRMVKLSELIEEKINDNENVIND